LLVLYFKVVFLHYICMFWKKKQQSQKFEDYLEAPAPKVEKSVSKRREDMSREEIIAMAMENMAKAREAIGEEKLEQIREAVKSGKIKL
jgi:molecular chaperone DnaK (HSP70)